MTFRSHCGDCATSWSSATSRFILLSILRLVSSLVGRDADSLVPMGTIINRQGTRGEALEWPRSDIVDHYDSTLRGRDVN